MRECLECGGKYPDGTASCPTDGSELAAEGAPDPYIGQSIGSYTITKCLGRGGMGAVYEAEHPSIGSKVAAKFLHRKYASDRAIVERFFNEARAVNVIGHDNIVKVSDFSQLEDGSPYFIMEFLEGRPLAALTDGPRGLDEIGPIFLQVADGLQAAHDKGIIHRDLKPDNIFLVTRNKRANVVKIVDFGIAKLQGGGAGTGKTATGMVMGTAQYMSPEQAGGEVNKISPASDVYSVGVIMFQLATGKVPFDGANFGEMLIGHLMKEPPAPRSLVPDIPEGFEAIILKCLAKKPEDRYPSMAELEQDLGNLLDSLEISRELPLVKSTPSNPGQKVSPAPYKPPSRPGRSDPGVSPTTPVRKSTRPTPEEKGGTALIPGLAAPGTMPPAKRSPVVPIVIGAVVVLGAAAAFVFAGKKPPEAAPVIAATAPEAPAAAVPTVVKISLSSTPASARVRVTQGAETSDVVTPATVDLQRDEAATVVFEAEGFLAWTETFTPTKDAEIRVTLAPKPVEAVQAAAPVEAPAAPEKKKKGKQNVGDGMVDVDF